MRLPPENSATFFLDDTATTPMPPPEFRKKLLAGEIPNPKLQ
jgi:hypothetical protein